MIDGLDPESCRQFVGDNAPSMEFIFSVGHEDVNELAPDWPGEPIKANWGKR